MRIYISKPSKQNEHWTMKIPKESEMEKSEGKTQIKTNAGDLVISCGSAVSVGAPIAIFILQRHKQSHLHTVTSLNCSLCLLVNTSLSQQANVPWEIKSLSLRKDSCHSHASQLTTQLTIQLTTTTQLTIQLTTQLTIQLTTTT